MTRRKKIWAVLAAALVLALVAGYFVANIVLERASRQALAKAVSLGKQHGLELKSPDFDWVGLNGPRSAMWSGVRAKIKLPEGSESASARWWDIQANLIDVSHSFSDTSIVKIDRLIITSDEAGQSDPVSDDPGSDDPGSLDPTERVIQLEGILCRCELSLFDPGSSLRKLLPEIASILGANKFQLPVQLGGSLSFSLRGDPVVIGIVVQEQKSGSVLRLAEADIAKLSDRFEERLTPAEVEIIAGFPLRAARLLEIKDAAESDSSAAHTQDASIPEDAYRHVLWSYLLAQTYGEEFAKQVGDSHEVGDTTNTPAERAMDYHNNAIGRGYAQQGVKRNSLLDRLLADPDIRREP